MLDVDSESGWGLLGLFEMLEPGRIESWLHAATGDEVTRRVPPEVVADAGPTGAALFTPGATSYEAVLDPRSGTLASWTALVGSAPALRLTLSVRNFSDVIPEPPSYP